MATECFCGCGRKVPLGRKRAANLVGTQFMELITLFEGALARGVDPAQEPALRELVAEGTSYRTAIREVIHGTLDRTQLDKPAQKAWWDRAMEEHKRMVDETIHQDYAGWNAVEQTQLINAGARAPATIVAVDEGGMIVNDNPRVKIRLRVEPPGGQAPFELERKVLVSRLAIPRAGERVEVAYDPDEPENFTFRMADLTDDAAAPPAPAKADPLDRLEKLGKLRDDGVITADEFETKKRELLEDV